MKRNSIPLCNSTITLFNRVETVGADGRKAVTWQKRLLDGCRYRDALYTDEGDKALLRGVSAVIDIPSDTDYLPRGEWEALDDKSGKFTLAAGDMIVRGVVFDVIDPNFAPATFLQAYRPRGAIVVTGVTDRAGSGEPMGYYRVEGNGL